MYTHFQSRSNFSPQFSELSTMLNFCNVNRSFAMKIPNKDAWKKYLPFFLFSFFSQLPPHLIMNDACVRSQHARGNILPLLFQHTLCTYISTLQPNVETDAMKNVIVQELHSICIINEDSDLVRIEYNRQLYRWWWLRRRLWDYDDDARLNVVSTAAVAPPASNRIYRVYWRVQICAHSKAFAHVFPLKGVHICVQCIVVSARRREYQDWKREKEKSTFTTNQR